MPQRRKTFTANQCIYVLAFYLLVALVGCYHGVSAKILEYYDISVDIRAPGRIFSPGSAVTGNYYNDIHAEWFLSVTDPDNLELYVYPVFVDLEGCCDEVRVIQMHPLHVDGEAIRYSGTGSTSRDQDTLRRLTSLPVVISHTGMVKVVFTTDHSVVRTGFALRFFARHKYRVVPTDLEILPAFLELSQLSVHQEIGFIKSYSGSTSIEQYFNCFGDIAFKLVVLPLNTEMNAILSYAVDETFTTPIHIHTQEFTITVAPTERIWLQVVHMNLSSPMDVMHTTNCRLQTEKIEIHETFCSMQDCVLAYLCRHSYTVTPVVLVTYGREALIRSSCQQHPNTDCAIINYKIYNPLEGPGNCPPGANTAHSFVRINSLVNLDHTFKTNIAYRRLHATWWFENTNPIQEIRVSVMANQLSRSPDCSTERIEIYSGRCIARSNLVTYFCGGVMDEYKLTTSRFMALSFKANVSVAIDQDRRFNLWIQVGNEIPASPPPYRAEPDRGYNGSTPYLEWNDTLDQFSWLHVTVVVLVVIGVSLGCMTMYMALKTRRPMMRVAAHHPVSHMPPAARTPGVQHPITSMESRMTGPTAKPPMQNMESNMIPHSLYMETYHDGGIPPPAVYNPPPLPPYPGGPQYPAPPYTTAEVHVYGHDNLYK